MASVTQLRRLHKAAHGLCICCAEPMPQPKDRRRLGWNKGRQPQDEPTLEHVFPRRPQAKDLRRMAALRRLLGVRGTTAAAHQACNVRKGNRPPTGCEVIFLMAVQERLIGKFKSPRGHNAPPMPVWALFDD